MKKIGLIKRNICLLYVFLFYLSLTFSIKATRGSTQYWCVTIESSGQSKKQKEKRKHWKFSKICAKFCFFKFHSFKSRSIEFLRGGNTKVFFPSCLFPLLTFQKITPHYPSPWHSLFSKLFVSPSPRLK